MAEREFWDEIMSEYVEPDWDDYFTGMEGGATQEKVKVALREKFYLERLKQRKDVIAAEDKAKRDKIETEYNAYVARKRNTPGRAGVMFANPNQLANPFATFDMKLDILGDIRPDVRSIL